MLLVSIFYICIIGIWRHVRKSITTLGHQTRHVNARMRRRTIRKHGGVEVRRIQMQTNPELERAGLGGRWHQGARVTEPAIHIQRHKLPFCSTARAPAYPDFIERGRCTACARVFAPPKVVRIALTIVVQSENLRIAIILLSMEVGIISNSPASCTCNE